MGLRPLKAGLYLFTLLGLLCFATSFAQEITGECADCDTVEVEAGSRIQLPDTTFFTGQDTVLVIPTGVPYEIKTPSELRTDAFYDSLRARSKRGSVRRVIHDALIRKEPSAVVITRSMKSEQPFVQYDGMTIRSIRLKKLDVWSGSVIDTTVKAESGFARTLNRLHVATRDRVLLNTLLFEEGDEVDPFVLADNERLLRNLSYIEDARIYVSPSEDDSLGVDIVVVTKDVFPYGVSPSVNNVNNFRVRVFNRNIAGLGHELSYRFGLDSSKDPSTGHEVWYFLENIRGTFTSGRVAYSNTWDTEEYRLTVSKGFLTPQTKYGGGLDGGVITAYRNDERDSVTVRLPYTYNLQDVWLGRSFQIGGSDSRTNLVFAGRFRREEYTNRPAVAADTNYSYHNERLLLARLTLMEVRYFKSSLIRSFGTAEDVPYGYNARLTFGFGDREFEARPYLGIEIGVGKYYEGFGYLGGGAGLGGFIDGHTLEEGVATAEVLYFSELVTRGRYHFRQLAKLDYRIGIKRLPDETIDIDDEIRGLSGARESTGNLALNLESVAFAPWDWYRFRFALYGYADVGFTGFESAVFRDDRFYGTLGIGCRIRNESLVFSTLNIQVGYLFRTPEGENPWYIDTSTENPQRFREISITKPDVIRFE